LRTVTGEPRPELKWSKDGVWVEEGGRIKLVDDAVSSTFELNISPATVEDSGVYSAEARNVHGTVQTTATVKVTEKIEKTFEEQRETLYAETVEGLQEKESGQTILAKDKVVVTVKQKESQETHEKLHEIETDRVEMLTTNGSSRQQTLEIEVVEKSEETHDVVQSAVTVSTQSSVMDSLADSGKVDVSEDTTLQHKKSDVSGAGAAIPQSEQKVQNPDVRTQSQEITVQETVTEDKATKMAETSSVTKKTTSSCGVSEQKIEDRTEREDEIREAAVSESLIVDEDNDFYHLEQVPEEHRTTDQVPDCVPQASLITKESTSFAADTKTSTSKGESKVEEVTTEEETEENEEEETEPVMKPVEELVKQPEVDKPAAVPEKPAAIKKQLVLEGVTVEQEQFEKVLQEVSDEVRTEEKVETQTIFVKKETEEIVTDEKQVAIEEKREEIKVAVEEKVETSITVTDEKTTDEATAELTLAEKPKEEIKVEEVTTKEETEEQEESEAEPVTEPVEEPVKQPDVEKPAAEPEKPAASKKQLVLEGVKVEVEQFEKVVQEANEEVQIVEEVETKRLPSGFEDVTVSELTSDSVTLEWEEPTDTGGVKIIRYLIVMRESDKAKYKKIGEVDGDIHSFTATKVKEGHEYHFRVYAQNEVGISKEAAEVATSVNIPKRKKEKKAPAPVPEPTPETVEEKVETETVVVTKQAEEIIREEEHVVHEGKKLFESKEETTAVVTVEVVETAITLADKTTKDEDEAELTLSEKPTEEPRLDMVTTEELTEQEEAEPFKEPVEEPVKQPVTAISEKELERSLPVLKVKPLSTTIQEGEVLRLACEVAKEPQAEISWSKDGKKLDITDANARMHMVEDNVGGKYLLEIAETTTDDIGEYTLSVESEGGIVNCSVSVSIIAKVQSGVQSSEEISLQTKARVVDDDDGTSHPQETKALQLDVSERDTEEKDQQLRVVEIPPVAAEQEIEEVTSMDHETITAREELAESSQIAEFAEVVKSTSESEVTSSAGTVAKTSEDAGIKTVTIKETVTKKRKKSKEKQKKTDSECLDVIQSVEEAEERPSEEMTIKDTAERQAAEEISVWERIVDKTVSITAVDDAIVKHVAEEVAAAELEEIEVEYSEEEFEGPLPVMELKPLPATVNIGETVRLAWKVAEESAAETFWSKNGKKVEPDGKKIYTGVDIKTGTNFLDIVESSTEDIGEYRLTVENEGGIVTCTVSVHVVDKLEILSAPEETGLPSLALPQELQQHKAHEQAALHIELPASTEPPGNADTVEVAEVEGTELVPRAKEAVPVFVSVPQPVCVEEGSSILLQCRMEG